MLDLETFAELIHKGHQSQKMRTEKTRSRFPHDGKKVKARLLKKSNKLSQIFNTSLILFVEFILFYFILFLIHVGQLGPKKK